MIVCGLPQMSRETPFRRSLQLGAEQKNRTPLERVMENPWQRVDTAAHVSEPVSVESSESKMTGRGKVWVKVGAEIQNSNSSDAGTGVGQVIVAARRRSETGRARARSRTSSEGRFSRDPRWDAYHSWRQEAVEGDTEGRSGPRGPEVRVDVDGRGGIECGVTVQGGKLSKEQRPLVQKEAN